MFAIRASADHSYYAAVTRILSPGIIVHCPSCAESFGLYARAPELVCQATEILLEYLKRNCPPPCRVLRHRRGRVR